MADLDWNDIRIFLALYRGGTVRRAAEELVMSHSTVSRHLTELETSLGAVLFTRSRDGLLPTGMATQILAKAEEVEAGILDLQRSAASLDSTVSGTIRLTCPPLLAQLMLMPIIADFTRRYPGVEIEMTSSYSFDDLMRGQVDVALRAQHEPDENLVGRRLPDFTDYVYAAPDYIAQHWFEGEDTSARWLGFGGDGDWVKHTPFPRAEVAHQIDDMMAMAQAAVAGMGMAIQPCYYADQLDGLVRVPGLGPVAKRPVWVLTHPDLRNSARIKTFMRFLVDEILKQAPRITGTPV